MEEMLKETLKLREDLADNIERFKELTQRIADCETFRYIRNVRIDFLAEIYKHFDERNILNAYGDIFFVDSKTIEDDVVIYIGRRVLWSMMLSNEKYLIRQIPVFDEDGYQDGYDYDIEVVNGKDEL